MNPNKVICNCSNVTRGQLEKAVKCGAKSVKEVCEKTYAAGCCGKCYEHVRGIVEERLEQKRV